MLLSLQPPWPVDQESPWELGMMCFSSVFLTEEIHEAIAQGEMSPEEKILVRGCATELLSAVQEPAEVNLDQYVIPF